MKTNLRLEVLLWLTVSLFLVVVGRLFYLQIFRHSQYLTIAEAQHWITFDIPARRGEILSSDGYPLATNETAYLLYAEPQHIDQPEQMAAALLPLIQEEWFATPSATLGREELAQAQKDLEQQLNSSLSWVALAHRLPASKKETLNSLFPVGLGFEEEPKRFYPEGALASHILGFVASDELGNEQGYFGLEGYYDGDLKGRPGSVRQEKNASGEPLIFGDFSRIPPLEGRNLVLTVNHSWQFLVEDALQKAVTETGATSGTVIIEEPQTGAILAMANYPNFNPGDYRETSGGLEWRHTEGEDLPAAAHQVVTRNLAVAATYEPGSVMKALTMSAGIEEGKITPATTHECLGPLVIGGYTIDTWNHQYHGLETMTQVLINSCNIGAAWVSSLLGADTLIPYFDKFGFADTLGIDLEGEDSGVIKPLAEWGPVELTTAAFGQGLSATPLQVVGLFSALANKGELMRPYVVSEIEAQERTIKTKPQKIGQAVSPDTAATVVEMLTSVIEESKSPFYTLRDHYRLAGKTGTAQIPVGGAYDPNQTNATFVGFLPQSRKFVMLVKLERPQTSPYAEVVAVPLWMEIAKDLVIQMGIQPDK